MLMFVCLLACLLVFQGDGVVCLKRNLCFLTSIPFFFFFSVLQLVSNELSSDVLLTKVMAGPIMISQSFTQPRSSCYSCP